MSTAILRKYVARPTGQPFCTWPLHVQFLFRGGFCLCSGCHRFCMGLSGLPLAPFVFATFAFTSLAAKGGGWHLLVGACVFSMLHVQAARTLMNEIPVAWAASSAAALTSAAPSHATKRSLVCARVFLSASLRRTGNLRSVAARRSVKLFPAWATERPSHQVSRK